MTQDEKIARTRQLLSAPPREHIMTQQEFDEAMRRTIERMGIIDPDFAAKPKRIQPEPNEIGYT
jgi:hypothetical protein